MKVCCYVFSVGIFVGLASSLVAEEAGKPQTLKPVKANADGVVALKPENTRVGFVGTHEGAKPDPRTGGFAEFGGKAQIADDGTLKSVGFEFATNSLWTEIPNLTAHLKSPDFLNVRQYPKATFQSTSVKPGKGAATFDITGKFTLLGKTKEITAPATVKYVPEAGLTLETKFAIDRTDFGMTFGEGRVKKEVSINVVVGAETAKVAK